MLCFACPNCSETMSAPEEAAGETVACPHCYQYLQVPTLPGMKKKAPPPPPPPVPPRSSAPPPPPRGGMAPAPVPPSRPQPQPQPQAAAYAQAPNVPVVTVPAAPAAPPSITDRRNRPHDAQQLLQLRFDYFPVWAWTLAALGIGLLLCTFVVFLVRGYTSGSNRVNTGLSDPELDVTALQLFYHFKTDKAAADAKYTGKLIYVLGSVDSVVIPDERTVRVYLVGQDLGSLSKVECVFKRDLARAANLIRNQRVSIKGICRGKDVHVLVTDCAFLDEKEKP
ncbi:MAG: hypothetical protein AB7K24_04370 [Gemmataceae bacterium]